MRIACKRLFSLHTSFKPKQTKLLINGQFMNSADGQTFETVNPFTEKVLATVQKASKKDVDRAVEASKKAFKTWSQTTGYERGLLMLKLADLMEKHLDELATLESLDNGKPINDAKSIDLPAAIQTFRYYAGWADKIHGATIPINGPFFCYTQEEPVGVCGQIYAWNYPLMLTSWKLSPALAAGCTSILKPAEQTPLSVLRLGELMIEAGFPPGVVQILTGFGDVGEALVKHPGVDKISFTGSTEVGRHILSQNGHPNIKRMTMELGGKSANIIMDDADIDKAIKSSQFGIFGNQGQSCIAGSRLFVHEKIYNQFVEKSVQVCRDHVLGDPLSEKTTQGPLVDVHQHTKVLAYIEKGKKEGAKALIGGKRGSFDKGFFVEPTVFVDVKDEMIIAKEEIFGPVMSILKFHDIDEVVDRANKSHYGLGAGVSTKNVQNFIRIANGLRAGTVYVNCYDVSNYNTPFGGFKDSGLGRELGEAGLRPYLETKCIIVQK